MKGSATYAFHFPPRQQKGFASQQCGVPQDIAVSTRYPTSDVEVLCDAIKKEAPALHDSRVGQFVLGACLALWIGSFARLFWLAQSRIEAARRLKQLLEHRRKNDPRP